MRTFDLNSRQIFYGTLCSVYKADKLLFSGMSSSYLA